MNTVLEKPEHQGVVQHAMGNLLAIYPVSTVFDFLS